MSEERLANNAAAIERLPGDTDPRPVILSIRGISKIYESVNALQNINIRKAENFAFLFLD